MKKIDLFPTLCLIAALACGCTDWLKEESPGTTKLKDFFTSGKTAIQSTTAAYVPLMWEYNYTYFSEWFIGDVASDDALKGGQNVGDMADAYDIENFKVTTTNPMLLDFYRAQFQGIGRCNLVLANVPGMAADEDMDERLRDRLVGEAYFLRAYYYFRLVRLFGGVPKVETPITSSADWRKERASAEDIYALILSDLENAESRLWKKSEMADEDLGRATKGAAQAMLMKVNLYMHNYDDARTWGATMLEAGDGGEYNLCPNYADNFTLAGENGIESVFEIQYTEDETSDYGGSDGQGGAGGTRGTFTVILTRSRSSQLGGGWGFNKPTQNLYDEFEEGDPRREATILVPTDEQIETPEQEIYLGSRYVSRKYTLMNDDGTFYKLAHETRGPINNKQIRYADCLLMYAEACLESGVDLGLGEAALNRVRNRSGLDPVPLTREALRHERRVELAMEGHRWFDLCRWGVAKQTMDAYKASESAEARAEMAEFVAGKHELMPIPAEEVRLGGLTQNPGY